MVGNTKIPDLTMKPNMSFNGTMSGLNTMSQNMRTKTTTPSMGVMSLSLPKTNIQTPTRQRAPQPTAPVTQPTTQVRQTAPTQPQNILASNVQPNTFTQASNTLRSQLGRNPTFGEVDSFMNAGSTPTPNVPIDTSNVNRDLSRPETSPVSQEQSFINELRQRYLGSTEMSPEEIELQRQLADVQSRQAQLGASEQLGLAREEGRAIAMPFITGRQAELSRQAAARQQALAAEAQPLTQELALRQAQRQLAQQRALKNLEFAQQDITSQRAADQAALGSIQEFGGQLLRIRPDGSTEVIAEAPTDAGEGFTLSPGQARFDAQGNLIAGVATQEQTGAPDLTKIGDDYYQFDAERGQFVPIAIENIPDENKVATMQEVVSLAQRILTNPQRSSLTGRGRSLTGLGANLFSAAGENFRADVNRLKNLLTVDNLGLMSGVLSESDIAILSSAATNLDTNLGDQRFVEELDRVAKKALEGQYKAAGIEDDFDSALQRVGGDISAMQRIIDQAMKARNQNFNNVGNDTNQVAKIAESIGQFESGGNYQARGPVVTSGRYKGERALGKYQIMPGNLPQWSQEILGYEVTPEQFLANPQIQDAIAQGKMAQTLKKYGTVEDVASVWFSGQPVARAGNRSDVLGTTVPQYVQNVVSNYNRLT